MHTTLAVEMAEGNSGRIEYPPARRDESVEYDYFGTKVSTEVFRIRDIIWYCRRPVHANHA